MARTPSKRWVEMVENFGEKERYCVGSDILYREDVAKLLSRQHASFVRLVKTLPRYDENKDYHETQQYLGLFTDGRFIKLDDLLAALQQGGKK